MASSLEIGNGWHTQTQRNTNDWQSPRISFSFDLSQIDTISPEKCKREDMADINYDTDLEFCGNGQNSIIGETHLAIADELFVDGKMLPLFHGPVEAQPVPIARHGSLENLRCLSPVRFTSSPAKITSSCWGKAASKSLVPNKWKEMLFKLRNNKENVREENMRRTSFKVVDQSQASSTKSVCSFSRICRTVGWEKKGNGLFRSLSFSRSHSTAERKYKACTSKEIETDLPGLLEGSKPPEAWRISDKFQPQPRYYEEFMKPRPEVEEGKGETKAKQYTAGRGKLACGSGLGESKMRRGMSAGQYSTGRVGGNGKLMVRHMDSPPPGKPMAEGFLFVKANNYNYNYMGEGMKVSPVVNVPVCISHERGSFNGGGGLFGFFSKREKKQPQQSAYDHHRCHYHGSTNHKKGHLNPTAYHVVSA